ncbi:MAG: CoA transferase [Chloroflexi bacterium]|nr:CoA transferase [Chloroflexota bacterium]
MSPGALSHVKAVEYCRTPAGSYCAKLMADLGAEVVKIEEPRQGDPARKRGPFSGDIPDSEGSGLFLYLNTNKMGVTLNLAVTTGKEIFGKLCAAADVLIEDSAPGSMEKLGLGFKTLEAQNSRLIMASLTPFGQTGPHSKHKAYCLNSYHSAGDPSILQSSGVPLDMNEPPVAAGRFAGDFQAATVAAIAVLAALFGRGFTGKGQYIDVSKQEALMYLNVNVLSKYPNYKTIPNRETQRYDYGGMMPCKDGYIVIQAVEQHLWEGLVAVMDDPEWAREERFKDKFSRGANAEELNGLMLEWLKDHTREDVASRARAKGVPVGSVMTIEEIMNYKQYHARGFFTELDHPVAGKLTYPTASYMSTEKMWAAGRGAPLLGEHNEAVYAGRLGYSKEDLVTMRQTGII